MQSGEDPRAIDLEDRAATAPIDDSVASQDEGGSIVRGRVEGNEGPLAVDLEDGAAGRPIERAVVPEDEGGRWFSAVVAAE